MMNFSKKLRKLLNRNFQVIQLLVKNIIVVRVSGYHAFKGFYLVLDVLKSISSFVLYLLAYYHFRVGKSIKFDLVQDVTQVLVVFFELADFFIRLDLYLLVKV